MSRLFLLISNKMRQQITCSIVLVIDIMEITEKTGGIYGKINARIIDIQFFHE
jgi:hypothetical protein